MSRRVAAGWMLAFMLAVSVAGGLLHSVPTWIAGLAAWVSGVLLWADLSSGQRRQCVSLIAVGLVGVAIGAFNGVAVDLAGLLDKNQAILALIAGVFGFSGIAGAATQIAWILFLVGLVVAVVMFVMGRRPRA